jgi:alkyldihydroxyacetonephosphate synthase
MPRGGRVAWMERYLGWRGCGAEKCLLLIGVSGETGRCREALAATARLAARHGGVRIGRALGEKWRHHRFRSVYLRNALWERGYAVDTLETALDWPRVRPGMRAIEEALAEAAGAESVHVYSHLSHLYAQGASVYTTYLFRLHPGYEENLAFWRRLKHAASAAIVKAGGTISHQHGVGLDHAPYVAAEKGELGVEAMRAVFRRFDPEGLMNPGKLC